MKILFGILVLLAVIIGMFFALNSHIYNEKQGDGNVTSEEGAQPSGDRPVTPPAGAGSHGEHAALAGTSWAWVRTELGSGSTVNAPSGNKFVLSFKEGGSVDSTTDCNSMGGTYTQNEEVLSFGPFMSTKMFCEGSMESDYASQLALAASHVIEGDTLRINLNRDFGVMVFERR